MQGGPSSKRRARGFFPGSECSLDALNLSTTALKHVECVKVLLVLDHFKPKLPGPWRVTEPMEGAMTTGMTFSAPLHGARCRDQRMPGNQADVCPFHFYPCQGWHGHHSAQGEIDLEAHAGVWKARCGKLSGKLSLAARLRTRSSLPGPPRF